MKDEEYFTITKIHINWAVSILLCILFLCGFVFQFFGFYMFLTNKIMGIIFYSLGLFIAFVDITQIPDAIQIKKYQIRGRRL